MRVLRPEQRAELIEKIKKLHKDYFEYNEQDIAKTYKIFKVKCRLCLSCITVSKINHIDAHLKSMKHKYAAEKQFRTNEVSNAQTDSNTSFTILSATSIASSQGQQQQIMDEIIVYEPNLNELLQENNELKRKIKELKDENAQFYELKKANAVFKFSQKTHEGHLELLKDEIAALKSIINNYDDTELKLAQEKLEESKKETEKWRKKYQNAFFQVNDKILVQKNFNDEKDQLEKKLSETQSQVDNLNYALNEYTRMYGPIQIEAKLPITSKTDFIY